MYISDILVYLGNNVEPTEIFGLLPIVQQRFENSDSLAFSEKMDTNTPFLNGFQNGASIGALVDTLSSLSLNTPDTYGIVKRFTLFIDPEVKTVQSLLPPFEEEVQKYLNDDMDRRFGR
jgi:hypothetical protein